MKCGIIRDLLPGYIDHLTCEESNFEIENHLRTCDSCREYYEEMSTDGIGDSIIRHEKNEMEQKQEIDLLKYFRRKKRMMVLSVCTAAVAVVVVICILFVQWISISYELSKPEILIFEDFTKIEYELADGETETANVQGLYFTTETGNMISKYQPVEVRELIIDGEPHAIAFVTTQSKFADYMIHRDSFFLSDAGQNNRQGISVCLDGHDCLKGVPVSDIYEVYYLDHGFYRVKNGGNGTLIKLIEKHGHLVWSREQGNQPQYTKIIE